MSEIQDCGSDQHKQDENYAKLDRYRALLTTEPFPYFTVHDDPPRSFTELFLMIFTYLNKFELAIGESLIFK